MALNKKVKKQLTNKVRQDFLHSFFSTAGYQEKFVNGFWLVKQYNPSLNQEIVAIYSQESYKKYKEYNNAKNNLSIL